MQQHSGGAGVEPIEERPIGGRVDRVALMQKAGPGAKARRRAERRPATPVNCIKNSASALAMEKNRLCSGPTLLP